MEDPAPHVLVQRSLLVALALRLHLAQADRRSLHAVRLPQTHVLDALDRLDPDAPVLVPQREHEAVLDALVLLARAVQGEGPRDRRLITYMGGVPVVRRRERVRAARPLLQLGQLVRGGHVRLVQLEPALVARPARRQAVITKIAREARLRDRRLHRERAERPAVFALPRDLHDAPDPKHHAGLVGVHVRRPWRAAFHVGCLPRGCCLAEEFPLEARGLVHLLHPPGVDLVLPRRRPDEDGFRAFLEGFLERRGRRGVVGDPVRGLEVRVRVQARCALLPIPPRRPRRRRRSPVKPGRPRRRRQRRGRDGLGHDAHAHDAFLELL